MTIMRKSNVTNSSSAGNHAKNTERMKNIWKLHGKSINKTNQGFPEIGGPYLIIVYILMGFSLTKTIQLLRYPQDLGNPQIPWKIRKFLDPGGEGATRPERFMAFPHRWDLRGDRPGSVEPLELPQVNHLKIAGNKMKPTNPNAHT